MLKAAHLGSHQSNIHKNVEFDVEDAKDVKDSSEFEEDKIQNNVEHVSNVENFSIFLLIQLSSGAINLTSFECQCFVLSERGVICKIFFGHFGTKCG